MPFQPIAFQTNFQQEALPSDDVRTEDLFVVPAEPKFFRIEAERRLFTVDKG